MFNFLQQTKGAGNAYASKSTARGKNRHLSAMFAAFPEWAVFYLHCTRWEYLHFLFAFALAPGGKEAAASGFQMLLALLGTTQPAMRGKPQALSFLISFKELICICIFLFAFADAISTIGIHPTSNEEKALFNVSFVSKNLSFKLLFSSKSLWVFFCQNFAYNARSVI